MDAVRWPGAKRARRPSPRSIVPLWLFVGMSRNGRAAATTGAVAAPAATSAGAARTANAASPSPAAPAVPPALMAVAIAAAACFACASWTVGPRGGAAISSGKPCALCAMTASMASAARCQEGLSGGRSFSLAATSFPEALRRLGSGERANAEDDTTSLAPSVGGPPDQKYFDLSEGRMRLPSKDVRPVAAGGRNRSSGSSNSIIPRHYARHASNDDYGP